MFQSSLQAIIINDSGEKMTLMFLLILVMAAILDS